MEMILELYLASSWSAGAKYRDCLPFLISVISNFIFMWKGGDLVALRYGRVGQSGCCEFCIHFFNNTALNESVDRS